MLYQSVIVTYHYTVDVVMIAYKTVEYGSIRGIGLVCLDNHLTVSIEIIVCLRNGSAVCKGKTVGLIYIFTYVLNYLTAIIYVVEIAFMLYEAVVCTNSYTVNIIVITYETVSGCGNTVLIVVFYSKCICIKT